jgi:anion-transporting  ArsA/GET3 family ATPase
MSLAETLDLAKSLEKLNVPLRKLLINNLVPVEKCKFCKARRAMQDEVLGEFQRKFRRRSVELFLAPQQPHEVRGAEGLREHFAAWEEVSHKGTKSKTRDTK